MRLGIYVGSFNPVHIGHIHVVNYLLEKNYIDKVLIIPTPGYWDKTNLANMEDRVNMLKNYETENIIVDTIHNNYKYTYEVLNSLKKDYPNDELFLIIGSDNIEKFNLWEHVEEILENKVIVVRRDNTDIKKYTDKFNTNNFIIVDEFNPIDISSSKIRSNVTDEYLDTNVFNYIKNNNLY